MVCVERIQSQMASEFDSESDSREMVVILDNIRSAQNVGSIFRTADGAGVRHLYLCGITPTPVDNPPLGKTSLGSEGFVPWSSHLNAEDLARQRKEEGYLLFALERTPNAVPIFQYRIGDDKRRRPMALILGNERAGVDPGLLTLCNEVLSLPMAGQKASLNVAVAFGVAAYWLMFA